MFAGSTVIRFAGTSGTCVVTVLFLISIKCFCSLGGSIVILLVVVYFGEIMIEPVAGGAVVVVVVVVTIVL